LTSRVVYISDEFCDIRERKVAIRSEIWTTNTRSLGFRDVRECVTLWGVDITEFRMYCTVGERAFFINSETKAEVYWLAAVDTF
jgi:hypothetical protein